MKDKFFWSVVIICATAITITLLLVQLFRYQYFPPTYSYCIDKLTGKKYFFDGTKWRSFP
ncbi:MAG: hypothetical protein RMK89_04285 [Armatimonadota bacterium]|nr:hypothetical protein [Armatimonadota bacterium]MCX7642874.1 hypothetical protein [Armatimonadota bacterium]MDW8142665.1 hypothetical protein [Armatimonadota bacterium]